MLEQYLGFIDTEQWWWEWSISLLIFLGFLLFRKFFTQRTFKLILRYTQTHRIEMIHSVLRSFEQPLNAFFVILGIYFALNFLSVTDPYAVTLHKGFKSVVFALIAWGFYNLSGTSSVLLNKIGEKLHFELDQILIPFLSKVLRVLVIALAAVVILDQWNYQVGGFIAGLGLGGLAISLAARDTLSNIFGGIVIITEKPFSLGDWIETPSVEGIVEDISFRSTRIRTFAQGLVTVPNSTLANEPITNWTRMGRRRITFHLGVMYNTPREKLKRCVDRIRDMLENHPEISKETLFVHFDRFNDSSLDIFLYFFTKTTVWGEWLQIKEEINFKIMEILEEEGVSIAFPSRSIYFENPLKTSVNLPEGPGQNRGEHGKS
ncbi:MscS Mechanosensitive ion channel [Caldalkalibacillus thermarum TA2.A1]|uniref:Mechanosensitive ion channel family protein n=1 Tax=Caldalkalibacillus thermarum (strain TA2.A1) TaxID=986075 RepID=F5L425_CALTT|nr:mechanosensitive ion channel family protein [Caldalkalibacillus thermarum]EGL83906.1 MscS Mechanosensitive ion channel [Caldalkalibacillus thermarum TA2.A1]QZT33856.1 mechanosensitive ion channel family protein [Caldalkalibacillus thermarum TA2.A1]